MHLDHGSSYNAHASLTLAMVPFFSGEELPPPVCTLKLMFQEPSSPFSGKVSHALGGGFGISGHARINDCLHCPVSLPGGTAFPYMLAISDTMITLIYTLHKLAVSSCILVTPGIFVRASIKLMSFTCCFSGLHMFSIHNFAFYAFSLFRIVNTHDSGR